MPLKLTVHNLALLLFLPASLTYLVGGGRILLVPISVYGVIFNRVLIVVT